MHSLKLNEGTYLRGWHAVCLKHEYDRETGVIFDAGFRWERPDGGVVWPFVTKLPRENPKLGSVIASTLDRIVLFVYVMTMTVCVQRA